MSFEKKHSISDGIHVVNLFGDLEVSVAEKLIQFVRELVDEKGGRNFFFDLSGVNSIDSSGLGSLVRILKIVRSADGTMHLVKPQPKAFRVFEITRLDGFFEFVDGFEAARNIVKAEG